MEVGYASTLTVDDYMNTPKVTWTSSNSSIATVSSEGKVTAVSNGLTLITATDENQNEIGKIIG